MNRDIKNENMLCKNYIREVYSTMKKIRVYCLSREHWVSINEIMNVGVAVNCVPFQNFYVNSDPGIFL